MKKILYTVSFTLLLVIQTSAQKKPIQNKIDETPANQFTIEKLFTVKTAFSGRSIAIKQYITKFTTLEADNIVLNRIAINKPNALEMDIPLNSSIITVQLVKSNVVNERTIFTTQNGKQVQSAIYTPGAYYYGVIKNQSNTLVAISFFNGNIIGVIANEKGNYVLGKSNTVDDQSNEYIIYNDKDLLIKNNFSCGTIDKPVNIPTLPLAPTAAPNKCVWVYIEADYKMYQDHSSNETNVRNFVTGLFNITTTLYRNESINTSLSEVRVWTSKDSYDTATSTLNALYAFGTAMKGGFNGDLAHLFSGRNLGGGIAWLDQLCDPDNYYKTAVSASLSTSTVPLPTYSQNANFVTHEMGHNLGSPHTHACAWNGDNTAIDGCGPTYGAGRTPPITYGGTCSGAPIPAGGGTIMSYCHLGEVGINFSNGFGSQPGDLIRNRVSASACLTSCTSGCPYNITVNMPINTTVKYEAANYIVGLSSVTTSAGQSVLFDAGRYVQLKPGFTATASGTGYFKAYIDGCGGAFITAADKATAPIPENKKTEVAVEPSKDALQVHPNPFTNKLTISYNNIGNDKVSIEVFSIAGARVAVLQQPKATTKGNHSIDWGAAHIPSGVYIIVLTTDAGKKIQKVVKL